MYDIKLAIVMTLSLFVRSPGVVLQSLVFFFFKQKTAYEMRISDWSSDVCASDLRATPPCRGDRGSRGPVIVSSPKLCAGSVRTRVYREIGRASCRERVCQYV